MVEWSSLNIVSIVLSVYDVVLNSDIAVQVAQIAIFLSDQYRIPFPFSSIHLSPGKQIYVQIDSGSFQGQ